MTSGTLEGLDAVEVRLDDNAGPEPDEPVVDRRVLVVGADGHADRELSKAKRRHLVAAAPVIVHLTGGRLQLALHVRTFRRSSSPMHRSSSRSARN